MGRPTFIILIIFILCSSSSWAQLNNDNIQIWFEDSFEGGKLSVTANFLSLAEDFAILSFEFESERRYKGVLEKIDFSSGEFLAAQNLPIPLTTQTVTLENSEALSFNLRIFQDNQLIAKDRYNWNSNSAVDEIENDRLAITNKVIEDILQTNKNKQPIKENEIAASKNKKQKLTHAVDALEIQGLIIDETRTKVGRDFYEIFFRKWIPPNNAPKDFTLIIKELPSFGRGGRVMVEVDQQSLGIVNLSPRIDQIEEQVNYNIRRARSYLSSRSKLSSDLENEDQSGSGIY